MGVKITRNEYRDLTLHDVTGSVSEEEMYDALDNFYKREPTALLLWDMSQADVSHVTPDILQRFVRKSTELEVRHQRGSRIAVVASEDLQYGLARMSEVFAELESAPYSFRVFRSHQEALQWLKSSDIS
jgi:hypothetical protein